MEQSDVETLVEELEVRVERLRALYDQYFMGIERLEPTVPRKDLERRLYVLRRTQIRNTGLRFRFQNVLLRYNTYQTYWIRICRQIEEGTYKRDVRRANARFSAKPRAAEAERPEREVHDTEPPGPGFFADEGEDVELDFDIAEEPLALGSDWLEELQLRAVLRPKGLPKDLTPRGPAQPEPRHPAPPTPAKSPPQAGGARYVQAGKAGTPSQLPVPAPPPPARPVPAPAPPPPTGATRAIAPAGGMPAKKKSRPSMPRVEAAKAFRPAPVAKPPAKPVREGHLSEERVRQIYTQYVDTKRSLQESTAALTFEGLSKSLQDSSDKLRQKHTGKSVDFEVAVKDGKTILRPVVK